MSVYFSQLPAREGAILLQQSSLTLEIQAVFHSTHAQITFTVRAQKYIHNQNNKQ